MAAGMIILLSEEDTITNIATIGARYVWTLCVNWRVIGENSRLILYLPLGLQ